MQLYILGENPQDRGDQLERLTHAVLEKRGYSNVTTNMISSGGHEIDVIGSYDHPNFRGTSATKMICECKAHSRVMNMPDWLKFLGKIYLAEKETKRTPFACFISLSGVNGNVMGSYELLKESGEQNIELITGEILAEVLIEVSSSISRDRSIAIASSQTSRKISRVEVAYYDGQLYWLVFFNEGNFSIICGDGELLNSDNVILEYLKDQLAGTFIDLREEKERERIVALARSVVVLELCAGNGDRSLRDISDKMSTVFEKVSIPLTEDVVCSAIDSLCNKKLCKQTGNNLTISTSTAKERIKFIRYALSNGFFPELLSTQYYQDIFDELFLWEIQKIQMGISLTQAEQKLCLDVFKHSPKAVMMATEEIQLITHHRKEFGESLAENLDRHDTELFLRMICESLVADYSDSGLKDYFCFQTEIEEVEVNSLIKVKSEKGIIIEHQAKERRVIAQGGESLGGQALMMLGINDSEEPWERPINPSEDLENEVV